MSNKKGFISTTIIYSFFLVFILLMIAMLMSYANKRFLLGKLANEIIVKPDIISSDLLLECTKSDTLSDCLFKNEVNEVYAIKKKIEEKCLNVEGKCNYKDVLDNHDVVFFDGNMNLLPSIGIDYTKPQTEYIKRIKDVIGGAKDYATHGGVGNEVSELINNEIGMYATSDDLGITYYYRGAEDDNFVLFADKLWSIVRINGDGSIRLIYQGEWNNLEPLDESARIEYIKKNSYIDVNLNDTLDSNDARHYNINKVGDSKCTYYGYLLENNKIANDLFCTNDNADNRLKKLYCNNKALNIDNYGDKVLNCGIKDKYNGATSLWNVGYLKHGFAPLSTFNYEAKLSNDYPSDIYEYLSYWYTTQITNKNYIAKTTYCSSKDIIFKDKNDNSKDTKYALLNDIRDSKLNYPVEGLYCEYENKGEIFPKNKAGDTNYGGIVLDYDGTSTTTTFKINNCANGSSEKKVEYFTYSGFGTINKIPGGMKCSDDGNSLLSEESFGLISADELLYAGAYYRENANNLYLSTDFSYWTSDLAFGNNTNTNKMTYYFYYDGDNKKLSVLNDANTSNVAYIKPVINLISTVKYQSGMGTIMNPYVIGD